MKRSFLVRPSALFRSSNFLTRSNQRFFSSQSHENADWQKQENTSKDIGNPITWANPTGGPSMQDKSPKYWRYIYPTGAGLILFGFYLAGRGPSKAPVAPAPKKSPPRRNEVQEHRSSEFVLDR